MIKSLKYYVPVFIVLVIGAVLLHNLLDNYYTLEQQKIEDQLQKTHSNALINVEAGIEVYASLVSSLRSFTKNTSDFPSELQLQKYLKDYIQEIEFNDSIVINYIDTEHVFKYVFNASKIDPPNLKGVSVKNFRPQERIAELDALMNSDEIRLFSPINLREGWAGFPFNFSARNNKDEVIGYVAPILNVKYLLDYFYENNNEDLYVHKFLVNDSLDLTREAFYNGSPIYNEARDTEYYKKFGVAEENFIYSTIDLFGLHLKVGSAYKTQPVIDNTFRRIAYIWYILMSGFIFIILYQFLKNKTLSTNLKTANIGLEKSLHKIQTLIKEVHHRIKNNMMMISGILTLQEDEYEDQNIKDALRESQTRIKSMSLVHEKLYGNTTLKDVKVKEYVTQLIQFVEDTVKNIKIKVTNEIIIDDELFFDADTAANLGLMINEFVTNSFKYAFSENDDNNLSISITKEDEMYKLVYSDSGQGLPDGFDIETAESLGMKLITIITEQLNGKLDYTKSPRSTFEVYFQPLETSFTA